MARKIICPECNTIFDEDVLKQKNSEDTCLVCGGSLSGEKESIHNESPDEDNGETAEKKTFYYYDDDGTLAPVLFSHCKPIYTFQATDIEDAERQLKEVCPNSPLFKTAPSKQIRCPRCFSTDFQLVPKKFSLLTGFATNRVDRVCVKCMKRF